MSDKQTFELIFEFGQLEEDIYHITLDHVIDNIYSDGYKLFELTESFVYLIEKDDDGEDQTKDDKRKVKKKKVAKRKGKDIVLSNKKDQFVFSPEAIINNVRVNY